MSQKTDTCAASQIEYAGKAVENAGTAIAIKTKTGVVIAVEKLVQSKLLIPGSNRRIFNVDRHIGLVRPFSRLPLC